MLSIRETGGSTGGRSGSDTRGRAYQWIGEFKCSSLGYTSAPYLLVLGLCEVGLHKTQKAVELRSINQGGGEKEPPVGPLRGTIGPPPWDKYDSCYLPAGRTKFDIALWANKHLPPVGVPRPKKGYPQSPGAHSQEGSAPYGAFGPF